MTGAHDYLARKQGGRKPQRYLAPRTTFGFWRRCPYCKARIKSGALGCRKCGTPAPKTGYYA